MCLVERPTQACSKPKTTDDFHIHFEPFLFLVFLTLVQCVRYVKIVLIPNLLPVGWFSHLSGSSSHLQLILRCVCPLYQVSERLTDGSSGVSLDGLTSV